MEILNLTCSVRKIMYYILFPIMVIIILFCFALATRELRLWAIFSYSLLQNW